jgi:hypothetical protein
MAYHATGSYHCDIVFAFEFSGVVFLEDPEGESKPPY